MNVNQMLRGGVVAVGLMMAGLWGGSVAAAPLIAQPNLSEAVAPAVIGFHRWHGGYSSRSWGSYNYGRPALYHGCNARPYRSVVRYNYRPSYSYGYVSPYVVNNSNYYSEPTCVNCLSQPVSYSQPMVYSQPAVYSQQTGYSQPVAYAGPVYTGHAYSTGYYARPAYYSGYSSYAYPTNGSVRYRSVSYGYPGHGYPVGGAYYPGYGW